MPNDTDQITVATLFRWTDDEWHQIARHLCTKHGGEPMRALDMQKIKARDVFGAQEVLPEKRHRKLGSIAQGFAGIRTRLETLTQKIPDGEQATVCAEKAEIGLEREVALETEATVSPALEQDMTVGDPSTKNNELTAQQSSEHNWMPGEQGSRSVHQAPSSFDWTRQRAHALSLMETIRPFIVMTCEEFAKALVKVISAQNLKETLPAASGQARFRVAAIREGILHTPVVEAAQVDRSTDKTGQGRFLADEADMEHVDVDFASQEADEEGDALDIQPLFDPKLPPSANSDFKPKIGLVSTPGL